MQSNIRTRFCPYVSLDVLLHLYASGLSFIEGNYEGRSFVKVI